MTGRLIKRLTKIAMVTVLIIVSHASSYAQCAMCRATLEANVSDGDTANFAAGLNFGILYLFFTPYILLAVVGYFWYKSSKANGKKLRTSGAGTR